MMNCLQAMSLAMARQDTCKCEQRTRTEQDGQTFTDHHSNQHSLKVLQPCVCVSRMVTQSHLSSDHESIADALESAAGPTTSEEPTTDKAYLVLDLFPDDPRHFVAVKIDHRVVDLDSTYRSHWEQSEKNIVRQRTAHSARECRHCEDR